MQVPREDVASTWLKYGKKVIEDLIFVLKFY